MASRHQTLMDLVVVYDGSDEEHKVTAGQREMARWEMEPFGCATTEARDKSPVLFMRYLAYAALKQAKRLPHKGMSFEDWDERVEYAGPEDDDADREVDPTQPGPPDAPSST